MTEEGGAMQKMEAVESRDNALEWLAVYTRSRTEKRLAERFAARGIEYYCPLARVEKQWSDRRKIVLEPVIRSYIFVRVSRQDRVRVLQTAGVVRLVEYLGKPAVIRPNEMDALMRFFKDRSGASESSQSIALKPMDRVRITEGVMSGEEGIFWAWKGNKAVIRLNRLNWEMEVIFDRSAFQPH